MQQLLRYPSTMPGCHALPSRACYQAMSSKGLTSIGGEGHEVLCAVLVPAQPGSSSYQLGEYDLCPAEQACCIYQTLPPEFPNLCRGWVGSCIIVQAVAAAGSIVKHGHSSCKACQELLFLQLRLCQVAARSLHRKRGQLRNPVQNVAACTAPSARLQWSGKAVAPSAPACLCRAACQQLQQLKKHLHTWMETGSLPWPAQHNERQEICCHMRPPACIPPSCLKAAAAPGHLQDKDSSVQGTPWSSRHRRPRQPARPHLLGYRGGCACRCAWPPGRWPCLHVSLPSLAALAMQHAHWGHMLLPSLHTSACFDRARAPQAGCLLIRQLCPGSMPFELRKAL